MKQFKINDNVIYNNRFYGRIIHKYDLVCEIIVDNRPYIVNYNNIRLFINCPKYLKE